MGKYFSLVLAGLAGSPQMVSCTLISLSRLVYEFHGEYSTEYLVGGGGGEIRIQFSSTCIILFSPMYLMKLLMFHPGVGLEECVVYILGEGSPMLGRGSLSS